MNTVTKEPQATDIVNGIEIVEVLNKKDLWKWVRFPNKL